MKLLLCKSKQSLKLAFACLHDVVDVAKIPHNARDTLECYIPDVKYRDVPTASLNELRNQMAAQEACTARDKTPPFRSLQRWSHGMVVSGMIDLTLRAAEQCREDPLCLRLVTSLDGCLQWGQIAGYERSLVVEELSKASAVQCESRLPRTGLPH
jgi:hypothetical protein